MYAYVANLKHVNSGKQYVAIAAGHALLVFSLE
jgi:hypothetical protein